jgi:butyryl-CoA dehydrogenase
MSGVPPHHLQHPASGSPLDGHLDGHLDARHVLSPRAAAARLPAAIQQLYRYAPQSLWQIETARLPRDLQKLRQRARRFADDVLAPLALQIDARPHWPVGEQPPELQTLLAQAGRAGWLSDLLPWPLGSVPPLRARHSLQWAASIKVEEFSRACGGMMLLLSAHSLGVAPVLLSGSPVALTRFVLPALRQNLRGEPHLFAFAITEPGAGSDAEDGHGAAVAKPGLVARRAPGGWVLNGRKCFISGGDVARSFTVFAALEVDGKSEGYESWTCFLVQRGMPGFRPVRTELKMGMRASGAAELEFADVFVPDSHVLGGVRGGWSLNRQTLNLSRLPVASMAVGFAQAACDIAADFACRTQVGGKALIHQQDVQLALAQMLTETSGLRGQLWACARDWAPRQGVASMNKFHATDTAMGVIAQAMDLLGQHALCHDQRLEKVYRDCRLTQIFEGTNQINRLAVIEDLQEDFLRRLA